MEEGEGGPALAGAGGEGGEDHLQHENPHRLHQILSWSSGGECDDGGDVGGEDEGGEG